MVEGGKRRLGVRRTARECRRIADPVGVGEIEKREPVGKQQMRQSSLRCERAIRLVYGKKPVRIGGRVVCRQTERVQGIPNGVQKQDRVRRIGPDVFVIAVVGDVGQGGADIDICIFMQDRVRGIPVRFVVALRRGIVIGMIVNLLQSLMMSAVGASVMVLVILQALVFF